MRGRERAFGIRGGANMIHCKATVLQRLGQIIGKPLIVFDQQKTQGLLLIPAHCSRRAPYSVAHLGRRETTEGSSSLRQRYILDTRSKSVTTPQFIVGQKLFEGRYL